MQKNPTVDEYILSVDTVAINQFNALRKFIKSLDPNIFEITAYGILGFQLNKKKIYVGGYKTHIGLYPGPTILDQMGREVDHLRKAKGTIHLSLKEPIPLDLVEKVIKAALIIK